MSTLIIAASFGLFLVLCLWPSAWLGLVVVMLGCSECLSSDFYPQQLLLLTADSQ